MSNLRWAVPASVMLGSAPTYWGIWGGWRTVTIILPRRVYEIGDDFLYSLYQKLVLFFFENLSGVEVILSGDVDCLHGKKENAILVSNHQSEVDWVIADILAARQGSIGRIRYILKDGLKYLPLYGFYFRQHSCIYVSRSGRFKEQKAVKQLALLERRNTRFWMVVFPEGTRYNPENKKVIERSKVYAEKNGFPVLEHVLTPRLKALQLCVTGLRNKADAIYDVTAAYSNTGEFEGPRTHAPGLADFLTGYSKQLHIHIKRIPISDVPEDEEQFKGFVINEFEEKDKLLRRFYATGTPTSGTLADDAKVSRFGMRYTLPVFLFFMGVNIPLLFTEKGRGIYWRIGLYGTFAGWVGMFLSS